MPHHTQIKVRGYHLDIYQHVNNARYLEFLEEARWAYLEDCGDVDYFNSRHLAWVIVNININYRNAATNGQVLNIATQFSKIGGKSAVIHQVVSVAGSETVVADADITFVCLDQRTGRAVAIDGELLERLSKHLTD